MEALIAAGNQISNDDLIVEDESFSELASQLFEEDIQYKQAKVALPLLDFPFYDGEEFI